MSYKTGRGNAAIFWPRFHALVIMVSDYQQVTNLPVAASRLTFREVRDVLLSPRTEQVGMRPALSFFTLLTDY